MVEKHRINELPLSSNEKIAFASVSSIQIFSFETIYTICDRFIAE